MRSVITMVVLTFLSRSVGQLFRSHFGALAWSDAKLSTPNRCAAIGLPIKAVVTGASACILAGMTTLPGPISVHFS